MNYAARFRTGLHVCARQDPDTTLDERASEKLKTMPRKRYEMADSTRGKTRRDNEEWREREKKMNS